jgi:hypothetical protein
VADLAQDRLPLPEWRERIRQTVEDLGVGDAEVVQLIIKICWDQLVGPWLSTPSAS